MAVDKSLLDEIQNDKENSGGSKNPTWKVPADGKDHTIRILPGFFGKTKKRWYEPLVQHWGPSPDGRGNNVAYPCLKEHFKKECPFCKAWDEAKSEERGIDESLQHCSDERERDKLENKLKRIKSAIKDLSFRRAYLHNVIDRSENTPTTRAFFAPKTVWDIFVNAFTNNADGDIFDPYEGHDFIVKRKTENNRTSYSASVKLKSSPITDDEAELKRLMKSRIDFPTEYLTDEPDAGDMEKTVELILSGAGKKRSFQEEDVPSRRRGDEDDFRPKKRKELEEDEDDFRPAAKKKAPVEDEDDFRPKKRKELEEDEDDFRPAAKKKAPVEDEDDFRPKKRKELEEDEDDFRPKKRKELEEDEDDFRPAAKKKAPVEDEDEPRPQKRRVSLDDDDDAPKPSKSAKDRLLSRFEEDDD
jgi:hypothetical protein